MSFKFLIPLVLSVFCFLGCSKMSFEASEPPSPKNIKTLVHSEEFHIMEVNSGGGDDTYAQSTIGTVVGIDSEAADVSSVETSDSQTQAKLGFMAIVSQLF